MHKCKHCGCHLTISEWDRLTDKDSAEDFECDNCKDDRRHKE